MRAHRHPILGSIINSFRIINHSQFESFFVFRVSTSLFNAFEVQHIRLYLTNAPKLLGNIFNLEIDLNMQKLRNYKLPLLYL
jgi:hypothetical protein